MKRACIAILTVILFSAMGAAVTLAAPLSQSPNPHSPTLSITQSPNLQSPNPHSPNPHSPNPHSPNPQSPNPQSPNLQSSIFNLSPSSPYTPTWSQLDLGVPAGDAHDPLSLAVDKRHGLVYVSSRRATPEENRSAVSIVHLATGDVLRRVLLPVVDDHSVRGDLLLSPDARRGYLWDWDARRLYRYNPLTNKLTLLRDGVLGLYPNADASLLLVKDADGLHAYAEEKGEDLWTLETGLLDALAVGDDTFLRVASTREGRTLTVHDLATGEALANATLDEWIDAVAPGPNSSWFVAGVKDQRPLLRRLDASLEEIAQVQGLLQGRLFYDARRGHLIYSGALPDTSERQYVSWNLDAEDLTRRAERRWPNWSYPDRLQATADALLGIRVDDDADRLYFLDPDTLETIRDTTLGVRLGALRLDESRGALFISDNQERIHRMDIISGAVTAVWRGEAPMSLDAANGRLYVNRVDAGARHVVALDADTGALLASFPQAGWPAADPQRDLVYIAQSGIVIYDRSGAERGRLASSFPTMPGFSPNPFIFKVVINPVTGGLVAFGNNGVPGSNNRDYIVFYAPPGEDEDLPADEPIYTPELDDRLVTVAFDRETGDAFLADASFRNILGIQRVAPDGTLRAQVRGRSGQLYFHTSTQTLFVQQSDVLAQFDGDLTFQGALLSPVAFSNAVLAERGERFFYQVNDWPMVTHMPLDGLSSHEPRLGSPLDALPPGKAARLTVLQSKDGAPLIFLHMQSGGLYISEDEAATWRQFFHSTLAPADAFVSQGPTGTLFLGNAASWGGDGVLRSDDAGGTWTRLAAGLTDLRMASPVHSVDPERLYVFSQDRMLFTWEANSGVWRPLGLPEGKPYLTGSALHLAQDGTLFLAGSLSLFRSTDDGANWEQLPSFADSLQGFVLAQDFTTSRQIFAVESWETPTFKRSDDAGATWYTPTSGLSLPNTGYRHLALLGDESGLYLSEGSYEGPTMLYRSLDRGDTWQMLADTSVLSGVVTVALGPAGRLWLATGDDKNPPVVRGVAPAELTWQPVPPSLTSGSRTLKPPTATPSPTPQPTAPPTATPTATPIPCSAPLSEQETAFQAQAPALGCPTGAAQSVYAAVAPFQNGRMIWLSNTRTIYALTNQGRWQSFPDTWDESQPDRDPSLAPPPGLFQPIRGFGKVWREQLGGPEAFIGWATGEESGLDMVVQPWSGGLVMQLPGIDPLLLTKDGSWRSAQ